MGEAVDTEGDEDPEGGGIDVEEGEMRADLREGGARSGVFETSKITPF
jgi:hypothetical protein